MAGFLLFGLGGGGFLDWFGWRLMVRGFAVFFYGWMLCGPCLGATSLGWVSFLSGLAALGGLLLFMSFSFFSWLSVFSLFGWLGLLGVFFSLEPSPEPFHGRLLSHSNKSLDRWMLSCLFFSDGVMKMHMDVMIIFLPEKTLTIKYAPMMYHS